MAKAKSSGKSLSSGSSSLARAAASVGKSLSAPKAAPKSSAPKAAPAKSSSPKPPPMPASAPYKSPKPVYSNAEFARQQASDFGYAKAAAGVGRDNQIAVERARARSQGQAQSALAAAQAAGQRSVDRNRAALEKAAGDVDYARGQKKSKQDRQQSLEDEARSRANYLTDDARNYARNQLERQDTIAAGNRGNNMARENTQQQADLQLRNQLATIQAQAAAQRSLGSGTTTSTSSAVIPNSGGMFGGGGGGNLSSGRGYGSGGGVGSGRGSGGGGIAYDDPSLTLAREQTAARERQQAADLAATAARQTAQLQSNERMQTERVTLERDRPRLQAESEEELRRKAAARALSMFNAGKPSYTAQSL